MGYIEEIADRVREIAELAGPAVAGVGNQWGAGSGIVLAEGRLLTNAHNVRGDEVSVSFSEGRDETGRLLGIDVDEDLAVLQVETGSISPIDWAPEAGEITIGSPVFALADPGGRGLRVTMGFVSGTQRSFRGPRGRRIRGSLEHTAPLLPGSSGGPIVDLAGRLLGINTNRLGEGFYLALPADTALRERVDRLAAGETPGRRRLGVAVAPPEVSRRLRRAVGLEEAEGLLVRRVAADSPAQLAGIKEGDLLVEAKGRPVTRVDELFEVIDGPDDSVSVVVLRGAERRELDVRFT